MAPPTTLVYSRPDPTTGSVKRPPPSRLRNHHRGLRRHPGPAPINEIGRPRADGAAARPRPRRRFRTSASTPQKRSDRVIRGGRARQAGRRRPGHDVRLRQRRDRRAHAAADPPCAMAEHAEVRKAGTIPYLRPDAKTQVTSTRATLPSAQDRARPTQHNDGIDRDTMIRPDLIEHVIRPRSRTVRRRRLRRLRQPDRSVRDRWSVGDAGLTGRKIIADTTAAWLVMAAEPLGRPVEGRPFGRVRHMVAKNIVAAGAASRCEIQVAYAIGMARRCRCSWRPSVPRPSTRRPSRRPSTRSPIFALRDLRDLDLRRPIYRKTAAYGHFGREPEAERTRGSRPTRSTTSRRL